MVILIGGGSDAVRAMRVHRGAIIAKGVFGDDQGFVPIR